MLIILTKFAYDRSVYACDQVTNAMQHVDYGVVCCFETSAKYVAFLHRSGVCFLSLKDISVFLSPKYSYNHKGKLKYVQMQ